MRLRRKAIDVYNAAVKKCGNEAEMAALKALDVWFKAKPDATIAETRDFCVRLLGETSLRFGNMAGDAAYALRSLVAEAAGMDLPDVDYVYEPDMEHVENVPRYQVEKLKAGDVAGFKNAIANAARYFSERGANDTMTVLGRADAKKLGNKVRFARVPTGTTTCPYCLMLASRGFVYGSELKAMNANHRNCDCRIVEGFEGMTIEGYDPDLYYDMWKNPEKYSEENDDEMSAIVSRSKHKLKDGRVAYSQAELDEVIARRLPNLKFPVKPTYSPNLKDYGLTRGIEKVPGVPEAGYKIKSIMIGPQKNDDENELVDTILHELVEARALMRGDSKLQGGDDVMHPYIDMVIGEYAKMRGWN